MTLSDTFEWPWCVLSRQIIISVIYKSDVIYIFFIGLTLVSNAKINMLIWTEGEKMTAPSDDICYKKGSTLFKRPLDQTYFHLDLLMTLIRFWKRQEKFKLMSFFNCFQKEKLNWILIFYNKTQDPCVALLLVQGNKLRYSNSCLGNHVENIWHMWILSVVQYCFET